MIYDDKNTLFFNSTQNYAPAIIQNMILII